MMARYDIPDDAWILIEPCLPPVHSERAGRPHVEHRRVMNGMFWVMLRGTVARLTGTLWSLENEL
ncbi:transposase [Xenorhabdus hominickii]|uniref:Transposase n=1 Tax=Xenorhabdus hominickii TaxID=351679 RepID=A0A2G0Q2Z7_XENHO|nr:transposase [Xenorhabdus hominickii]